MLSHYNIISNCFESAHFERTLICTCKSPVTRTIVISNLTWHMMICSLPLHSPCVLTNLIQALKLCKLHNRQPERNDHYSIWTEKKTLMTESSWLTSPGSTDLNPMFQTFPDLHHQWTNELQINKTSNIRNFISHCQTSIHTFSSCRYHQCA